MNTTQTPRQSPTIQSPTTRLTGIDIARFLAFVGMVIVNFTLVMGAEGEEGLWGNISHGLQGRAAASFVMLAGLGLGLMAARGQAQRVRHIALRRALFFLAIGLVNMLIFDADIIHFYAFYFLIGALVFQWRSWSLLGLAIGSSVLSVILILIFDFEQGWDLEQLSYTDFWSVVGFLRNVFFNGWHPVVPWIAFFLIGVVLARAKLEQRGAQLIMILGGTMAVVVAETASSVLTPWILHSEPGIVDLFTTEAFPPMPLYLVSASGFACLLIGGSVWLGQRAPASVVGWFIPAGRQALTLYIGHIVVGMGLMEWWGLLGGQTGRDAAIASAIFCIASVLYARHWSKYYQYGPLEWVMRRLTSLT